MIVIDFQSQRQTHHAIEVLSCQRRPRVVRHVSDDTSLKVVTIKELRNTNTFEMLTASTSGVLLTGWGDDTYYEKQHRHTHTHCVDMIASIDEEENHVKPEFIEHAHDEVNV